MASTRFWLKGMLRLGFWGTDMKLTFRHMAAFDAVARHASLGRAAESLALSPSAVSMALKELAPVHVRGFGFRRPFHLVTSTRVCQGDLQRAFVALASEVKPGGGSGKRAATLGKSK